MSVITDLADGETHCGHDARYIVSSDEGTSYCEMCEALAREREKVLAEVWEKILCKSEAPMWGDSERDEYMALHDEARAAYEKLDVSKRLTREREKALAEVWETVWMTNDGPGTPRISKLEREMKAAYERQKEGT